MFKKGDEVFIRQHTDDEKQTYPFLWLSPMDNFEGNCGKIKRVLPLVAVTCYEVEYGRNVAYFIQSSLIANKYEQF